MKLFNPVGSLAGSVCVCDVFFFCLKNGGFFRGGLGTWDFSMIPRSFFFEVSEVEEKL